MAQYKAVSPDGQYEIEFNAPDDATDEQLQQYVQTQAAQYQKSAATQPGKGEPIRDAAQVDAVYQAMIKDRGKEAANEYMLEWMDQNGGSSAPPAPAQASGDPNSPLYQPPYQEANMPPTAEKPLRSGHEINLSGGDIALRAAGQFGDAALPYIGRRSASALTAAASLPVFGKDEGKGWGDTFSDRYNESMTDFNKSQKEFQKGYPKTALGADVAGSMVFGNAMAKGLAGVSSKVLASKNAVPYVDRLKNALNIEGRVGKGLVNYGKAAAAPTIIGATEAGLKAPEGETARFTAVGAGMGAASPAVEGILRALGHGAMGVGRVLKKAVGKEAIPSMESILAQADDVAYNVATDNGRKKIADVVRAAGPLDKNAIAADYLGDKGTALIKASAVDSGDILKNPELKARIANTGNRTQEGLRFGAQDSALARTRYQEYEAARQGVGAKLEEFIQGSKGEVPYKNQGDIREFLGRDILKDIKNKAGKMLNAVEGDEIPRVDTAPPVGGAIPKGGVGVDTNTEVFTPKYVDYINKELQKRIDTPSNPMTRSDTTAAQWIKIKNQFNDLLAEGATSKEHKALLTKYGETSRVSDAYKQGLKLPEMTQGALRETFEGMTRAEQNAFKHGSTEALFNAAGKSQADEAGLLTTLNEVGTRNKLKIVYGDNKVKALDEAINREEIYKNTSVAALAGASKEAMKNAETRLSPWKNLGIPIFGHRRAYSLTGLSFAGADALVEALGSKTMDPRVRQEVSRILMNSKTPALALSNLESRQLGREAAELVKKMKKRIGHDTVSSGISATLSRLLIPDRSEGDE